MNLMMNEEQELRPRITVFGVGGAGGNAVNNMIEKQLDGVEFVVANTDAQALAQSRAGSRIQMGPQVTEGLGAGAKPSIGAKAAEETIEDIVDHLMGAHMCFITAGMGGGTGTGAAPIIAQAAREMGILTVGVVTKPFQFEGAKRMRQADEGVQALQQVVDTLIIIPNQNLFRLANEKTTFTDAFAMADDVLYQGVKGVTDLMVRPGLINLDFADVRAVMDEMGKAMMGTGQAEGENRAREAAERAIANPLLDEVSLNGARGVLINITGGYDMTLFELDEAANVIREKVDGEANIIVGSTLDPDMEGSVRVSVVATGIDVSETQAEVPAPRRSIAEPLTTTPSIAHKETGQPDLIDDLPVPPRRVPAPAAEPVAREATNNQPAVKQEPVRSEADDLPPPAYDPRSRNTGHSADLDQPTLGFVPPKSSGGDRYSISDVVNKRMRDATGPKDDPRGLRNPQPVGSQAHGRMSGLARMFESVIGSGEHDSPKPPASTLVERVNQRAAAHHRRKEVDYDDLASPERDDDNVEIPAFLRRQAN